MISTCDMFGMPLSCLPPGSSIVIGNENLNAVRLDTRFSGDFSPIRRSVAFLTMSEDVHCDVLS